MAAGGLGSDPHTWWEPSAGWELPLPVPCPGFYSWETKPAQDQERSRAESQSPGQRGQHPKTGPKNRSCEQPI